VPPGDDPWYCALCRPLDYKGQPQQRTPQAPKCELCPHVKAGAFKPTDDGKWAHQMCALWCPDTAHSLIEHPTMEPVSNVGAVSRKYRDLKCSLCGDRGCCVQCSHPACTVAFHPICGRDAGMKMLLSNEKGLVAFCSEHRGADT